jgi:sialate O-acetylesterase
VKIEQGLFDNMVLQRVGRRGSDAVFSGVCPADGVVRVTVRMGKSTVRGFSKVSAGVAAGGRMRGRIQGLPAGGPYDMTLEVVSDGRTSDSLSVRDVLVGDVWLLGGQSNMEGIGYLKHRAKPVNGVRAFYMDDRWAVAEDPIHNLDAAVDQVHRDLNGGQPVARAKHVGVGPGVAFGQAMFERTGIPQGLIACAHGGTSMGQWDPALSKLGSRSLFGAMVRRFKKNGSRVAGVVWYQGCSDASPTEAPRYTERMVKLIRAMRRTFGQARLPVVAVQISRVCGVGWSLQAWNSIQDQQRRLQTRIPACAVVPAIDLELDDGIHISGRSQHRLGRRLAQAMAALRGERDAGRMPVDLDSVLIEKDPVNACGNVRVRFKNVMGSLRASGRALGFEIAGTQGPTFGIYHTELHGREALLRTGIMPGDLKGLSLHYGYGTYPCCNVTDGADRSLPVFGPVPCGEGRPLALTPFVTAPMVSRAMPPVRDIAALAYPARRGSLGLKRRAFPAAFCDLHLDLLQCAPKDVLVYFLCRIRCAERMKLGAGIGYDGPVKMWIDGRARFTDPHGVNPANIDKAVVPFDAAPGEHEILIALGSNFGRAWGIHLRFVRRDVSRKAVMAVPATYRMPEILS